MDKIELKGKWKYKTVDGLEGDFFLPGSACENNIGLKQNYYDELTKEAVRAPRQKFNYIDLLYLKREIDIPVEWEGKYICFYAERINIASSLFIDDEQIGRKVIELSTPHIYDLSKIKPGKHTITLCVDNRNILNIDTMASGYSIDTQDYWNGVIGDVELRCEENIRIGDVSIFTDDRGISLRIVEISDIYSPMIKPYDAQIDIKILDDNNTVICEKSFIKPLFNSKQPDYFRIDTDKLMHWDEFNPVLYAAEITISCNEIISKKNVKFGVRTIKTEGKKILLNGRQIALRGTIDCAQYPLTGYPPTDIDIWLKNFKIVKEYGLNHVRFHAWCPPECAFRAADLLGIYISVEMPLWLNKDVCALEFGDDPIHEEYYMSEAFNISRIYGNHPSFIMFSCGNENMGDFAALERITTAIKSYDGRRLYTLTSNFDHPILPCEDYLCAYDASGRHVRIQNMQDKVAENTSIDYREAVKDTPVPIISFEVGQYCSYPDVDICNDYTGNIIPVNFDVIKKDMIRTGVYGKLKDYVKASGDLAVRLYKEDIEAGMRTHDFGGFELLSLIDYTGQSTATVGILDVFYRSKGLIEPCDWRKFCNDVVPLFKAERIYKNTSVLEADFDLYNFGRKEILTPIYDFKIKIDGSVVYSEKTTKTHISIPLSFVTKPSILEITLNVDKYENSWKIYVFTEITKNSEIKVINTREKLEEIAEMGGRALVTRELFENEKEGSYIPVFWSPVHFPTPKPCGAIINKKHDLLMQFPTEKYPDYQWKKLFDNSVYMKAPEGADLIVETVPNFMNNEIASPLFEVKYKKAKLLYCGFDLESDDITVKTLKQSIASYLSE